MDLLFIRLKSEAGGHLEDSALACSPLQLQDFLSQPDRVLTGLAQPSPHALTTIKNNTYSWSASWNALILSIIIK